MDIFTSVLSYQWAMYTQVIFVFGICVGIYLQCQQVRKICMLTLVIIRVYVCVFLWLVFLGGGGGARDMNMEMKAESDCIRKSESVIT